MRTIKTPYGTVEVKSIASGQAFMAPEITVEATYQAKMLDGTYKGRIMHRATEYSAVAELVSAVAYSDTIKRCEKELEW